MKSHTRRRRMRTLRKLIRRALGWAPSGPAYATLDVGHLNFTRLIWS